MRTSKSECRNGVLLAQSGDAACIYSNVTKVQAKILQPLRPTQNWFSALAINATICQIYRAATTRGIWHGATAEKRC